MLFIKLNFGNKVKQKKSFGCYNYFWIYRGNYYKF